MITLIERGLGVLMFYILCLEEFTSVGMFKRKKFFYAFWKPVHEAPLLPFLYSFI
jgi:hypothetical protein